MEDIYNKSKRLFITTLLMDSRFLTTELENALNAKANEKIFKVKFERMLKAADFSNLVTHFLVYVKTAKYSLLMNFYPGENGKLKIKVIDSIYSKSLATAEIATNKFYDKAISDQTQSKIAQYVVDKIADKIIQLFVTSDILAIPKA